MYPYTSSTYDIPNFLCGPSLLAFALNLFSSFCTPASDDDDGDDECQKMDESIYTNEEDRNDDVRVGKNMVESIKALMESNKRLRTENALLRQDLNVIRVIADPQSPDSGQEKKKKRKRRFSRS